MYSSLSKRQLLERLFSNAGIYGIGVLITRLGGLVLLPIYWHKLDPADFGVIGLAQVITICLTPILNMGLSEALQRMYFEWKTEERPQYLAALWIAIVTVSPLLCLALHLLGEPLFAPLLSQVAFYPYLVLAIWIAFVTNLASFPLALMRVREELRTFTLVTLASFFTQAGLVLTLVYAFDMRAYGYLLGTLLGGAVWGAYYVYFMAREIRLPFRLANLAEPLRYALPTVPGSALENITSIFDRIFLDKYVALGTIGLYNLGNQFGAALNSFNQIIKSSWVPLIFRVVSDRTDGPAVLGRLSLYYIAAMAVPALLIALLSKELIELVGNERYHGIYPFIPFFVLIYYIQAIGSAMGRGIDLAKKTVYSPVVPAVMLLANLVAMWLLVPRYGVAGAIAAYLIATIVRVATHIGLAFYFYPRPLFAWRLLSVFIVVGVAFIVGNRVDTGSLAFNAVLKSALISAAALAIVWTALDREQALQLVRVRVRKLRGIH